jgi:hypothetical protein
MKNKILLFLKLPPPLTGATIMNSYVSNSKTIANNFNNRLIPISFKDRIEDVRVLSIRKIITIINLYFKLIKSLLIFKPSLVYFQVSPTGIAFYRDCTFIFLIKIFGNHIVYHIHGKV